MIAFILAGAAFLTVATGFAGISLQLAAWTGELGLTTYELLTALTIPGSINADPAALAAL